MPIGINEFIIAPHIINLKLIRTTNLTDIYTKFITENFDIYKNNYIDEIAINIFNQGRIGRIPMRYCAHEWIIDGDFFYKNSNYQGIMVITKEEYELSKNNRAFVHFAPCKPWKNQNCKFENKWWFLVEKIGIKNEMKNMTLLKITNRNS